MPASTRASRTPHRRVAGQGERAPVASEGRAVLHAPARAVSRLGQGIGGAVGQLARRRVEVERGERRLLEVIGRPRSMPVGEQAVGDGQVQLAP